MWGWGCPQASPQSAAVAGYDDDEGFSQGDDDGGATAAVRETLLPVAPVVSPSSDAVGQRPTPDAMLGEAEAKVLHCVPLSDTTSLSTATQNAEPGDAHVGADGSSDEPGKAGPRQDLTRGTSFTSNDWLKRKMRAARQRTASCAAQVKKPKSQYNCGLNTVNVLGVMTFENVCKALAAPHCDGGDAAAGPAEHIGRAPTFTPDGRPFSEPAVPRPGQMEDEAEEGQWRRDPLKFQDEFKAHALNEVETETLLPHTCPVLFTAQAMHDAMHDDDDEEEEDHEEEFTQRIAGCEPRDEDEAAPSHVVQDEDQAVPFHLVKFLKSTLFLKYLKSTQLKVLCSFSSCEMP